MIGSEWYNILIQLFIVSLSVERALKIIFDLAIVKRYVDEESAFFPGTDFKAMIALALSMLICIGLDWRVLAIVANKTGDVPSFIKWIDYYVTGSLISSGTERIVLYFKEVKAKSDMIKSMATNGTATTTVTTSQQTPAATFVNPEPTPITTTTVKTTEGSK